MARKQIITTVLFLFVLSVSGANAQQQLRGFRNLEEDEKNEEERNLGMVYSEALGGWVMEGSANAGSTTSTTTTSSNRGSSGSGSTVNANPSTTTTNTVSTTTNTGSSSSTTPTNIQYNPNCARYVNSASMCCNYEFPLRLRNGKALCVIPITDANRNLPGCPGRDGNRGCPVSSRYNPDLP